MTTPPDAVHAALARIGVRRHLPGPSYASTVDTPGPAFTATVDADGTVRVTVRVYGGSGHARRRRSARSGLMTLLRPVLPDARIEVTYVRVEPVNVYNPPSRRLHFESLPRPEPDGPKLERHPN